MRACRVVPLAPLAVFRSLIRLVPRMRNPRAGPVRMPAFRTRRIRMPSRPTRGIQLHPSKPRHSESSRRMFLFAPTPSGRPATQRRISLRSFIFHSNEAHSNAPHSNTLSVNISCFVNLPVLISRMTFDHPIRASALRANIGAAVGNPQSLSRLSKHPFALPNPRTPENPILCFQALAHCPLSLTSFFALCFDTLAHSSSRNSPEMIIIHHALGVFSPTYVASAAPSVIPRPEPCAIIPGALRKPFP